MVRELSDAEFDDFTKKSKIAIIDMWADWCMPCKMVAPTFEQLAKEYAGKIEFAKLDIMANPEAAQKYGVVSIPAFLIFKNGEKVGELFGAMPKHAFKEQLEEFL